MKYYLVTEDNLLRLENAAATLSGATDSLMEFSAANAECRINVVPEWASHFAGPECKTVVEYGLMHFEFECITEIIRD